MLSIEKARKVLGQRARGLSDHQVENIIAQFQFLADGWLDSFERSIFKGKIVKELLTEKDEAN